ncbi:MAG: RDD family protein, partial [Candidatus Cloacimonetes bacterium]|nr:RDD family protein [Candidatus Cloacimonadota bacterium]
KTETGSPNARALNRAMLQLATANTPENLPPAMNYALSIGDSAAVDSLAALHGMVVMLAAGGEDAWRWREGRPIQLNALSLLGKRARTFSLFTVILVYFTGFTWLLRGRTPGKWLLGIRVLRLNGKPMGLWDSFGRAGGYSASVSTAFLGFLEAIRDSNRMALHDRIAGTVVIRSPWKNRNGEVAKPTRSPRNTDPRGSGAAAPEDASAI